MKSYTSSKSDYHKIVEKVKREKEIKNMGNKFLKSAARPVTSVKEFLRDSADNSIKYKPEAGKKHIVYIPFTEDLDESGNKTHNIIAIQRGVHEMTPAANKYDACICLEGIEDVDDEGNVINDGSCPFCDRVGASWDIYRYKMDVAKKRLEAQGFMGEQLDAQLKTQSQANSSALIVKKAKPYIYMLIVQYKLGLQDRPEIGPDGLPVFELKVMKLSDKGIAKIQETFDNSGLPFEGSEVVFKYGNEENAMRVAGSRNVSPVFQNRLIDQYPRLKEAIDSAVAKWQWDGIEKAFREWTPCSTAKAKAKCDEMFRTWDAYCADPSVGFLEGGAGATVNNPALETKQNAPVPTNMQIGTSAQSGMPGMSNPQTEGKPQMGPQMGFGNMGFGAGMPDPNSVFNNGGPRL